MKNLKKKILLGTLSLFFFSFLFTNYASANATLTNEFTGSGKVTIKAIGLFFTGDYTIGVYNNSISASTPSYNKLVQVVADSNGAAQGSFDILVPNGSYTGFVAIHDLTSSNVQAPLATINFTVPVAGASTVVVTTVSIEPTQAILNVSGLTAGVSYTIKVVDNSSFTPAFQLESTFIGGTDDSKITISGLESTGHYRTTIIPAAGIGLPSLPLVTFDFVTPDVVTVQDTSIVPDTVLNLVQPSQNTTTPPPANTPTQNIPNKSGGLIPACPATGCGFNELMQLINNFIRFILFGLAVPIAAVMFVYAGFEMVTSGGSAEQATKARHIFTNAVIGIALAAASWLIIELILKTLGYNGSWIGF